MLDPRNAKAHGKIFEIEMGDGGGGGGDDKIITRCEFT